MPRKPKAAKKRADSGRMDLRDPRIPGGRMTVSLRTTDKALADRRRAAVRRLIELGEWDVLARIRARELRIEDVTAAVEGGKVLALRPTVSRAEYTIGVQADKVLEEVTPGAFGTYDAILRIFRKDFGDGYPMDQLTREDANGWLRASKETNGNRPWSPNRRAGARMVMGRVWADAIYRAAQVARTKGGRPALDYNPWRDTGTARGTQEEIRARQEYLTPEQWGRLLDATRGTPRAAFYALCCLAGLRRTEALMLRTRVDVELPAGQRGRIRIQPREGAHPWKPKTKRSVRDVPICAELREILDEHVRLGFAGERYFIHPPKLDVPFGRTTVSVGWAPRDFKAARLPHGRAGSLTVHSLRHTFASWLVQRGADLLTVAKLLGDTVAMVEKVYAHLRPQDLETVVDLLNRRES